MKNQDIKKNGRNTSNNFKESFHLAKLDKSYYLNMFQQIAERLDKKSFDQERLEYKTGIWMNSVVLKFQKKSWLNNSSSAKFFEESVFCSIWLSDASLATSRLEYNIHALKMRELKAYSIQSREFAQAFRAMFQQFKNQWPHVELDFGPLTLMEGWLPFQEDCVETDIRELAQLFLKLVPLIDDLFVKRKKIK